MNGFEAGFTDAAAPVDDARLVARIAAAHGRAEEEFAGHGTSFWSSFEARHSEFKAAFMARDRAELARLLRDPSTTELFWGFDDLVVSFVQFRSSNPEQCRAAAKQLYSTLLQIAVAVGTIRCPYPEAGQEMPQPNVEEILSALDQRFGFRVDFPNPFRLEFGLATSRGVAGYRAIQALFQAWRLSQIALNVKGRKVLEIGAGLGRTCYYARKFGLTDYTIVDIPITQVAQGYFLGRVLGETAVSLCGEAGHGVRLRSPAWLHSNSETFDVVMNVDSLTEMDREHALAYVRMSQARSGAFLSINHEFNATSVAELLEQCGMAPISRSPYWPRAGYVEELFVGRLGQLGTEQDRLHAELGRMRASRSWRATALLRTIRAKF